MLELLENDQTTETEKLRYQTKLADLETYKMAGIKLRTRTDLDNLYDTGRKINKTEECRKGNAKFVLRINKENNTVANTKQEILNEIERFYQ